MFAMSRAILHHPGGGNVVRCGGCGEEVQERCKEDPSADIERDPYTLYYNCNRGHGYMPHFAVCMASGGKTSPENPPPGRPIPTHYLTAELNQG
jgi:hypothetical protein